MNLANEIRRLLSRLRGVISLAEFGAILDGATDDLSALQRAAAYGRKATLIVDGPCYVSANVTIPSTLPVRFEADGAFTGPGVVTYTAWSTYSTYPSISYSASSGQATPNNAVTTLTFAIKEYDTHNAWSGTTFTVPAGQGGKYRIEAAAALAVGSGSGAIDFFPALWKNGAEVKRGSRTAMTNAVAGHVLSMTIAVEQVLAAGDTLQIKVYAGSSGTIAGITNEGGASTYVNVSRFG